MKVSESLISLYQKAYGEFDQVAADPFQEQFFYLFAQAPHQGPALLDRMVFEAPAQVLTKHKESPQEAKMMLMRAIAGSQAWEQILMLEYAGPTEEDWDRFLDDTHFFDWFK